MNKKRQPANRAIPIPTSELGAGNEYGWSDDLIRRSGLPKDVFELLHDIAYHHEGRDVNSYVIRAQQILSQPARNAALATRPQEPNPSTRSTGIVFTGDGISLGGVWEQQASQPPEAHRALRNAYANGFKAGQQSMAKKAAQAITKITWPAPIASQDFIEGLRYAKDAAIVHIRSLAGAVEPPQEKEQL